VYTLDTNAILYYLKDDNNAVTILRGVFAQSSPAGLRLRVIKLELLAFNNLTSDEESLIEKSAGYRCHHTGGFTHRSTRGSREKPVPNQSARQHHRSHRDVYRQYIAHP
jgi:hypothetical protein